jgi:PAS domain S-box-containing protein
MIKHRKSNPIADHEHAVEEARITSQFARNLFEASLDSLVTISPEGKITDVNEATIKVTGAPREELVGTDFSDYFTEPELARRIYQLVFANGFETDYPLTMRHRNGDLTEVFYNASVYRDADGTALGVFASARDVTEQKRALQYARSLIEASLDPLVMISPEGKITDVNEATTKVTGIARDGLIGTDFSDHFTEPERAREAYQKVFANGAMTDYPLTMRHKDGALTDVRYNASVYKDAFGNGLGVFAAARDVTAQKKAEAEIGGQRRRELERLAELEKFQRLTIGRELKMIELKQEIDDLKARLDSGARG